MPRTIKIGLIASFLLLLTVNLVLLDVMVLFGRSVIQPSEIAATTIRVTPIPSPSDVCNTACQSGIDALSRKMDALSQAGESTVNTLTQPGNSVKEYYIPLGSGTTKSNVWQDIAGAEAVIDTTNFPTIKSATFEVFLNIPTANGMIKAKLYNVTDKHDVWFSEVSGEGPTLTKKEASISLETGAKTYRVMGLSSLKYEANIENARIRIVTY